MTAPDTQGPVVDVDAKRQRGLEPDELPAVYVALGVGLIAIVLAVVTYSLDSTAVWIVGLAAGLIVLGLWGGIRGAVGVGAVMLVIGGMVLTHDWSLGAALLMNGVLVSCALTIMVGADLSFVMRRGSQVASPTVQGLTSVHVLALAMGIVASALVVGTVEAIDWPSSLLIVPIAVLAVVAVWMARQVRKYRTNVQAVDAPVIGQGPAAQAAESSWRQFRWKPGDGA